ncbi:MAG: hypothetical protein JWO30_1253 [Fibrobacteres bacterium]|nr:hypothetical protein [Fibrobacterota bacterium]
MSSRIHSFNLAALSLLAGLALVLPAQSRAVVAPVQQYSVSPNPAPADKAFTLYLSGAGTGCGTTFTRESVTVVGKRIDLSYVANSVVYTTPPEVQDSASTGKADIVCPVYDQPANPNIMMPMPIFSQPTYNMPALKAGAYEVWVTQMSECMYAAKPCLIAPQAVSAGTLTVQPAGAITYSITPTTANAGKDFELSLLSYQFTCGTVFSNLATDVVGNVITLSFLDRETASICPAIYKAYGPTYKMTALKAGTYKVMAYRLPACYPCKMLGETVEAGTLTVGPAVARVGWFLKEGETLAGKPFTMNLLNNALGNCGTSFSHKSVTADAAGIYASFLVEHQQVECLVDLHPYGPSFEMAALKAGAYPVYVTELLACQVTAPYCAVKIAPALSDTLIVSQTLSVMLSELRAHSPKVDMIGSRAAFILPQGIGGIWKTELLTLSGRRLSASSFAGEGGGRAEIELGGALEKGVYLLRLQAPDGETHMLPVVRKD